ncbi:organomercurial lyase [Spirillospora sp. CA-294931]|uniref:organomercurial lyase n=1 Tax=Spirillospora sp. CA-294931 TaxID=3240042 RepID=UPI003D945665
MGFEIEDLRLAVYRGFAETGRAPEPGELVDRFGGGAPDGLRELAEQRHVVLGADGRVVMAHPFASIPLGFAVMGERTLWWGGCAWDSFALPHLVPDEPEVLVSTRCPGCGRPHALVVDRHAPPEGPQVAHFLVPVSRMWDDVVHTCGNQRLFCGEGCVDAWLREAGHERGYVMDLGTLWRLARGWYAGRLDRGYTRREPAAAAGYFREAGLTGAFWGL